MLIAQGQPERLLPTIRSRTIAVHVPPLATEVVQDFLVSVANVDPDAAARADKAGVDLTPPELEKYAR